MSRASSLHRLQAVDSEIDRARLRQAEMERLLADAGATSLAKAQADQTAARLGEAQAALRDAENAVGLHKAKMTETEHALYGGSVRNPKELQDLESESQALARYLATLEDRLLEAMLAVEEYEREYAVAVQRLELAEEDQRRQFGDMLDEQRKLVARLERLQGEREAAEASVTERDLALYRNLRDSKGGTAVALMQDGSCTACGLTLAASEQQAVRGGGELFRCKQCGRVLYYGG
jgi:predicted  nucleic acid-binding Zn-ribbon protein